MSLDAGELAYLWRDLGVRERFIVPGRSYAADADLRAFTAKGASEWERLELVRAWLVPGVDVDLRPFGDGVELGPLASAQVYFRPPGIGQAWAKAHGPGCRHEPYLRRWHELSTLSSWLPWWIEQRSRPASTSDLCAHCGGFSLRRLETRALDYYFDVVGRPETIPPSPTTKEVSVARR